MDCPVFAEYFWHLNLFITTKYIPRDIAEWRLVVSVQSASLFSTA
jgi:hypothetical protein